MKIFFVRHGKDDDRYRGGWSAHDLTPEGRIQAAQLAKHLRNRKENYNITKIISSDLKRALTTAEYISEELGIPVQQEPQLRVMNNGDLAGMLNAQANAQYPGLYFNTLKEVFWYPLSKLRASGKLIDGFEEMLSVFTEDDVSEVFYQRSVDELRTVYY